MKHSLPPPPASYRRSHVVLAPVLKFLHMSCSDYSELALRSMDQPLKPGEKWRLWLHHVACSVCRDFRKQMDSLSALVRSVFAASETADPDPAFLDAVRGKLTGLAEDEAKPRKPDAS